MHRTASNGGAPACQLFISASAVVYLLDRQIRPTKNALEPRNRSGQPAGGARRRESVMNRTPLVHLAVITFVCAVRSMSEAAQDMRVESASRERAPKAQTSTAVQPSSVFQRTFTWVGNKVDGLGEAKDG